MNKGLIASQLSFSKGASPLEYMFAYGENIVGVVVRKGAGKNKRWEVEDAPEYSGMTREEAVAKYLAADLRIGLAPLVSHRWISTTNGSINMRYFCPKTGETYDRVDSIHTLSQICKGCGATVSFEYKYATAVAYTRKDGEWHLHPKGDMSN